MPPPQTPQINQSKITNELIDTLLETHTFDNPLYIQETFQNINNQKDKAELTKALEICKGDENMFKKLSYLLQCSNRQILSAVIEASPIYSENKDFFQLFYNIALSRGKNTIKSLIYCEKFYGKDLGKFQLIVSLINKSGGLATKKFVDAAKIYGDNSELQQIFFDISYHKGSGGIDILSKFKEIYLEDVEKCESIANLIKIYGKSVEEGLFKDQSIFQKLKEYYPKIDKTVRIIGENFEKILKNNKNLFLDEELLDKFLEISEELENDIIKNILSISNVWLNNVEYLEIISLQIIKIHKKENERDDQISKKWRKENIESQIAMFESIYKVARNHSDIFFKLIKIKESQGSYVLTTLLDKKNSFSSDDKAGKYSLEQYTVLLEFVEQNPKNRKDIIFNLSSTKTIIKHDVNRLKAFIKYFTITKVTNRNICQRYIEIYEEFGEEKALLFAESVKSLDAVNIRDYRNKGIYKVFLDIYEKYDNIDSNIIKDFDFYFVAYDNIFDTYYDIYTKQSPEEAKELIGELKSTKKLINQDYIDIYINHHKKGGNKQRKDFLKIMQMLVDINKIFYNQKDKEIVSYCNNILLKKGIQEAETFTNGIKKLKNVIKKYNIHIVDLYMDEYSLRGIEKSNEFIKSFLLTEEINISNTNFILKYLEIYQNKGFEGVKKYIEYILTESKKIISPDFSIEKRQEENYMILLENVFPNCYYSNHEKNIKSGDKTEHLEGYSYNKNGYSTQLSGLLGYQVKEGKEENEELLEDYQKRLSAIKDFLGNFRNERKKIEIFEKKVDNLFQEIGIDELKNIKGLYPKDKLFAIYVSLAIKGKGRECPKTKINNELIDLIIMYRYVYLENINDYIRYTMDETKQHKDLISQRYIMWKELSVVYGENLKHNIRNDIFHDIENAKNFEVIKNIFAENIEQSSKFKLKSKQKKTIKNTFENDRIEDNKRFDILLKQLIRIFGSNIEFQDKTEKREFEKQLKSITSSIKSKLNYSNFERIIDKLTKLRNKYMFSMEKRIENLFSQDINIIFEEVSKYEEKVSSRIKNSRGDKVKTSIKKRNIRGYFMKTQESTNARMGAHLCISGDSAMWKNPNYFEFVMKDEDTGAAVGMTMLLSIKNTDGGKYLWFGPNPYESFLDKVSPEKCYNYMYDVICKFAEENGFDGVVIPPKKEQIQGLCTNRGGEFPLLVANSMLKDGRGNSKIVNFSATQTLSGTYTYQSGALIWEK